MGRRVGIDLGLSWCVVAIMEGQIARILDNKENEPRTRSAVSLKKRKDKRRGTGEELLVGQTALDNWALAPKDTVVSVRRLMGRSADDPIVDEVRRECCYQIKAPSQGTRDSVAIVMGDKEYSPIDLSAMILAKLKEDAEFRLCEPVTHAVITVPAYFSQAQYAATRKAGLQAGLKVIAILDEPTAVALAFGLDATDNATPKTILVYDLGGSTFDVSILMVTGSVFAPLDLEGDMWLGGDRLDEVLVDYAIRHIRQEYDLDPTTNIRFMVELKKAAQAAKERLSSARSACILVTGVLQDRDGDLVDVEIEITRQEYERMIKPLVDRTVEIVRTAVGNANLTCDQIDHVLMAGNTTRVPLVQQAIEDLFGVEKIIYSIHPKHVVAMGAAKVASMIHGTVCQAADPADPQKPCDHLNDEESMVCEKCGAPLDTSKGLKSGQMNGVAPFHYGILTGKDQFEGFIQKNDPYPTPVPVRKSVKTQSSGQRMIYLPIYSWTDRSRTRTEEKQGHVFAALPPGLPAGTPVHIGLWLDDTGCFEVEASLDGGVDLHPAILAGERDARIVDRADTVRQAMEAKASETPPDQARRLAEMLGDVIESVAAGNLSVAEAQLEELLGAVAAVLDPPEPHGSTQASVTADPLDLAREGQTDAARLVLQRKLEEGAVSSDESLLYASLLVAAGADEQALPVLRDALNTGRLVGNRVALYYLGLAAARLGHLSTATDAWERILAMEPSNDRLRRNLARLYYRWARQSTMDHDFLSAVKLFERYLDSYVGDELTRQITQLLAVATGKVAAHIRGLAFLAQDRRAEAAAVWADSLDYLTDGSTAHALSVLYWQQALALELACMKATEALDTLPCPQKNEICDPLVAIRLARQSKGHPDCFWGDGKCERGVEDCELARLCRGRAGAPSAVWTHAIAHRVHVAAMKNYWEGWCDARLSVYGDDSRNTRASGGDIGARLVREMHREFDRFEQSYGARGWTGLAGRIANARLALELEERAAKLVGEIGLTIPVKGQECPFAGGPALADCSGSLPTIVEQLRARQTQSREFLAGATVQDLAMLFGPLGRASTSLAQGRFSVAEQMVCGMPYELTRRSGADLAAVAAFAQAMASARAGQWLQAFDGLGRALQYGPSFTVSMSIARDFTQALREHGGKLSEHYVDDAVVLLERGRRLLGGFVMLACQQADDSGDEDVPGSGTINPLRECVAQVGETLAAVYCKRGVNSFNAAREENDTFGMEEALQDLERACGLCSGFAEAREQLASGCKVLAETLSGFRGDFAGARRTLLRALKWDQDNEELNSLYSATVDAERLAPIGDAIRLIHDDPVTAASLLERAIRDNPDLPEARDLLVSAYRRQAEATASAHDFGAAIALLQRCLELCSADRAVHLRILAANWCKDLAIDLSAEKRWTDADAAIEDGLAFDPGSPSLAKVRQAISEARDQETPEIVRALRALSSSLDDEPDLRRAVDLILAGEHQQAVALLRGYRDASAATGRKDSSIFLASKLIEDVEAGRISPLTIPKERVHEERRTHA